MKLILAADENWAIGKNGDLLCHLSGDLKYFKKRTLDKTVVMGRKTLESLPGAKPLPKRRNIVLTSKEDYNGNGAEIAHSEKELKELLKATSTDDVMIIGGGQVYRDFLPLCDTCYITKIHKTFDADTYFVNLDEDESFEVVWQSGPQEENGISYEFFEYRRK